jgi:Rrf2 family protein
MGGVYVSAKSDYALRAALTLAATDGPMTADAIAAAQALPPGFLDRILGDLRTAGLLSSQRGSSGGWRLARPAAELTVGDVMRAVDGPLAQVHGLLPEHTEYRGAAVHLQTLWVAMRASLRTVLDRLTLADLAAGRFPDDVRRLLDDPEAWRARRRP